MIIGPLCESSQGSLYRPDRYENIKEAFTGQIGMGTYLIEVTEFKSGVRCDLQAHLEAAMA